MPTYVVTYLETIQHTVVLEVPKGTHRKDVITLALNQSSTTEDSLGTDNFHCIDKRGRKYDRQGNLIEEGKGS